MYNFKQALEKLKTKGRLEIIKNKVTLDKISDKIKITDKALLFENTGTDYRVASNG
jgi:3-polyprenyl-4-hydroxybenzoate decarboxylase